MVGCSWRIPSIAGLVLALAGHGVVCAQTPYLVKDIDTNFGSYPSDLITLGDAVLFNVTLNTGEQGLWRSDGTAAGTFLLRAFDDLPIHSTCRTQAVVNGRLFFAANGTELWRSDGTAAGTVLVRDLDPLSVCRLMESNGTLFFEAAGLWKSDGTGAGTTQVTNVALPDDLTDVNGTLFFSVGNELWKSDGTTAGTTAVATFTWAGLEGLANANGTLFFSADDGTHGFEPWRSDGSPAGTVLVKDIDPIGSSYPAEFTEVGGTVFFRASDGPHGSELWRTDGTPAGTVMVKDVNPGLDGAGPNGFKELAGRVFFFATDDGSRYVLATSDGTEQGTANVAVFDPSPATPYFAVAEADRLYFSAYDGASGIEPWTSDGTPSGTIRLADIAPGPAWSMPIPEFTPAGNRVFFAADDQVHGRELWAVNVSPKATSFYTLDACRVVDTRGLVGPSGGPPLAGGTTRTFSIAGHCGIPATARAVALTLTVVGAAGTGSLRVFPAGSSTFPGASAVNFPPTQARGSNGIFGLGKSGGLTVRCDMSPGTGVAHLILDVQGYFE